MLRGKIIESNMPSTKISLHTMSIKPYDIRLEVVVQWLLRALNIVAFYNAGASCRYLRKITFFFYLSQVKMKPFCVVSHHHC